MNIKSIVNAVKKSNDAYKKMTQREKRVTVAKDALAQLFVGSYVATPGTYVSGLGALEDVKGPTAPVCNVCAIGSLLVSNFRLSGKTKCLENVTWRDGTVTEFVGSYDEVEGAVGAFRPGMLLAMEHVFEHPRRADERHVDYELEYFKAAGTVDLQLIDDSDVRLFAILENIVENGGDFKPKKIKTKADLVKAIKDAEKTAIRFNRLKASALKQFEKLRPAEPQAATAGA